MEKASCPQPSKSVIPQHVKGVEQARSTPSPEVKLSGESDMEVDHDQSVASVVTEEDVHRSSIDIRLKEQFNFKDDRPPKKKRRLGLCEEIIISVSCSFSLETRSKN